MYEKEDVLYVGDSGVDMQTAANAGVTACGVTWGFRPRTELEEFNPAYMADVAEKIKKKWSFNDDILTRIIMIRQVKLQ